VFFGIITRQAIRRGSFTSVKELKAAIETFIDGWNARCEPFIWTKTPDEILAKANRKSTSNTRRERGPRRPTVREMRMLGRFTLHQRTFVIVEQARRTERP
jgi:hypothetical protein